ncbi:hypothetical protein BGY98DRAFT_196948 [Russula aff. rugulosa BPL654]|nr:hypothetical protein BGY98DRAFT_196948 [Russula aff. rugulosa BPL654]
MNPEFVLGADILYHPDMIAPFLATLNIALQASKSPAGGTAYLALTVRNTDLLNSFLLALSHRDLSVEELPQFKRDCSLSFVEQSEGVDQEVRIYKIKLVL